LSLIKVWQRSVKEHLLPDVHGHQAKSLAAFSLALLWAAHCHSGRLEVAVPGRAQPASARRRLERLLANRRLHADRALQQLARVVLDCCAGRLLLLLVDETPQGNRLRCLKVSLAYRGRALPLQAVCYRPGELPEPLPRLLWKLLRRLARCRPKGAEVLLLADRGLSWPLLLDLCRQLGWHYLLRVQGSTRLRLADGREYALEQLAPRPGRHWTGSGQVFKKAGWRPANVVATWEQGSKEPWLLITDLPASLGRCRQYLKRGWTEQLFRDEKSQGFRWGQSRVSDPGHALRLVLLLALASVLALSVGTWVVKRGLRHYLESRRHRLLSYFQLGLRWLEHALVQDQEVPCQLYLCPP
jgi:Transposase DDE domain